MRRTVVSLAAALIACVLPSIAVAAPKLPAPPKTPTVTAGIEDFAAYQPQFLCLGKVEPGVRAFEHLLLTTYPATTSLGDMRACSVGGTSEH